MPPPASPKYAEERRNIWGRGDTEALALRGLPIHSTLAMQLTPECMLWITLCTRPAKHGAEGPFPAFNGRHTEPAPSVNKASK